MTSLLDKVLEFAPLAGALAVLVLVPVLELPFRRFVPPFVWAIMGLVASRPLTTGIKAALDLHGRRPDTLILFQSGTILAVLAIAVGERVRRARVPLRALLATLGILSVPMTALATRVLDGYGPREMHLGVIGAWVSLVGYVAGPAALAALVFLLAVHRIELYEELGH